MNGKKVKAFKHGKRYVASLCAFGYRRRKLCKTEKEALELMTKWQEEKDRMTELARLKWKSRPYK